MGFKPDEQPALSPITGSEKIHASDVNGDSVSISAAQIAALATGTILTITKTISSAEILALDSVDISLIPAGGADTVIVVNDVLAHTSTGTVYGGGGFIGLELFYNTGASFNTVASLVNSLLTGAGEQFATGFPASSSGALTAFENVPVVLSNQDTAWTGGTKTLTLVITYSIATV